MDKGRLHTLQLMQNTAARIVTGLPKWCSRDLMFDRIGWLTVQQLIFYHTVILVYKIRKNNQPEHLAELLKRDSRNNRIMIPRFNLQMTNRSFTVRGADSWNLIPRTIREESKIGTFKKMLKDWVKNNVFRFPE